MKERGRCVLQCCAVVCCNEFVPGVLVCCHGICYVYHMIRGTNCQSHGQNSQYSQLRLGWNRGFPEYLKLFISSRRIWNVLCMYVYHLSCMYVSWIFDEYPVSSGK